MDSAKDFINSEVAINQVQEDAQNDEDNKIQDDDKIDDEAHEISNLNPTTICIKNEESIKIDSLLNDLYKSGKSKSEILDQLSKFCFENKLRRSKILEIHKRILHRNKL
uniref:Uncharacterized protein n=1 Tax=Euplotes harpa TaxID=151035 RepID=A0A7S3J1D4_9SPIT|mmetsp:Transcript_14027/g.16257  ORF Transcript_14027/g.16257 Transcript_14027/m.16257 type:complete len:109 (+) Transcript_14027:267-593(+)